jgi:hypothetical protein
MTLHQLDASKEMTETAGNRLFSSSSERSSLGLEPSLIGVRRAPDIAVLVVDFDVHGRVGRESSAETLIEKRNPGLSSALSG